MPCPLCCSNTLGVTRAKQAVPVLPNTTLHHCSYSLSLLAIPWLWHAAAQGLCSEQCILPQISAGFDAVGFRARRGPYKEILGARSIDGLPCLRLLHDELLSVGSGNCSNVRGALQVRSAFDAYFEPLHVVGPQIHQGDAINSCLRQLHSERFTGLPCRAGCQCLRAGTGPAHITDSKTSQDGAWHSFLPVFQSWNAAAHIEILLCRNASITCSRQSSSWNS